MSERSIDLEPGWLGFLAEEFTQPYMVALREFLQREKSARKTIFPSGKHLFNAFNATPLEAVKVVILGQDPYHGPGQAHGLCFSVPQGLPPPPSLKNIFKEIHSELGIPVPAHGNLTHWAEQGVLLLNSVLSVESGKAASHQGRGWEQFTDRVIDVVNQQRNGVVFMLWGSYAQRKGALIDSQKHLVLKAPHPSPLSAHRGFFGCGHFLAANDYLKKTGAKPIDWALAEAR
ncbi:MAG: uracil-DNA glycosylase [Halioglobus sp.]